MLLKYFIIYIKIADILIFININIKYYILIFLKKGNYAFLRLYKNYNIPINAIITKKLK